jgi:hypothetical protein
MALRKMRISYYTFLANTDKKSFTCLPTFWVLEVLEVYPGFASHARVAQLLAIDSAHSLLPVSARQLGKYFPQLGKKFFLVKEKYLSYTRRSRRHYGPPLATLRLTASEITARSANISAFFY